MFILGRRETTVSSGLCLLFLSTQVAAHTLRASSTDNNPATKPIITKIIHQTTVQRDDSGNARFENVEQDADMLGWRASIYGEHVPEILSLPGFSWPRPSTRGSSTTSPKPTQSSSVTDSEMGTTFTRDPHTTPSLSIPFTPSNPLQERDSAYWRLRVHISHIDGLLEIYMRWPQAIAFCENIPFEEPKPKETSEEDSAIKENNTSTYYELLLGEGDTAANIKIPEDDAIRFCETVTRWVDKDWRTRSKSASRKTTKSTPTSTKATRPTTKSTKSSAATPTTSTTKSACQSSAKRTLTRWSRSRRTRSTHPGRSSSPQTSHAAEKTVNVSLSSNREISSSTRRSSWPPPGFETDKDFFTLFSSIASSRACLTAPSTSTSTPTPSAEALEEEDTSTRAQSLEYQYPPILLTPPSPSPSPTQIPPSTSSSRAPWDKMHDPAIVWTVVFGWTVVGLQVVVGGWEFARNARGDVRLGVRVVRGVRRARGVFA